jgi:hypothetical protein
MRALILAVVFPLLAGVAAAEETSTAVAEEAGGKELSQEQAAAAEPAKAEAAEEFKVPPGFKAKKRGKHTVYCMKTQSIGTRFENETCFDEEGLKDYLLAREQNRAEFERARAVCVTSAVCAPQ